MNVVSQQLLRALRGKRTQRAFARRLGFRANPITDWEHGRRSPTAVEALGVAERAGVDVVSAFARFAPTVPLGRDKNGILLDVWMRQLLGTTSITEISLRLGRSRPAISRWLAGTAHPRLPAFLEFVDAATGRLPDLVAELVPIEKVPALKPRFDVALAARRLAHEHPWTEAILRVLETSQYQALPSHDPGWVARQLGLEREQVTRCLQLLLDANVLTAKGGKYAEQQALNVDTRGGKGALWAIKAHWSRIAAERALGPIPGDLFAYNVCSCSQQDMDRIRALLRATYQEVRAIVAGTERCDEVALINLHFVGWPTPQ
jgi:transcriptional regulator with XRE-family HTH domain